MIDCPYCLTPQSFHRSDNCEACGTVVPRQYIDIARTKPPIWIVTYGPTAHGKSTLLSSATFLMESLSKIAPRAFPTYLDDFTTNQIALMRSGQYEGRVMNPTVLPLDEKHLAPLLIALKNFPRAGDSYVFVIFDLPGEVVDVIANHVMGDLKEIPLWVRAVTKAKTVWFIASLYNIQQAARTTGRTINNLFYGYQQAMSRLNVSLKDRDILVTYTKADLLMKEDKDQPKLPDSVAEYLENDPYYELGKPASSRPPALESEAYITDLVRISEALQIFTEDEIPGGSAFIAMAEDSGAKLNFTMNSAQGSDVPGIEIERIRVIDALLWTIGLNPNGNHEFSAVLILPIYGVAQVYSSDLPVGTHDVLRSYNVHPSTYFMGDTRATFPAGTAPVGAAPPSGNVPLIGPTLDRLPKASIAVVLVGEVLPLDLDDFADTTWDDRLLLIGTDKTVMKTRLRWKYQAQTVGEVEQIVREFTRYLESLRGKG